MSVYFKCREKTTVTTVFGIKRLKPALRLPVLTSRNGIHGVGFSLNQTGLINPTIVPSKSENDPGDADFK